MIYGYARVSTRGQLIDGNSIEDQTEKLKENGCTEIVTEQYTGTTTDRPKFKELVETLKAGDVLKVTKLDRFARTAGEGSTLAKQLLDRGVSLHILNMGMIDNSAVGHLLLNVLLSFAEFERDMIVERTQEGKAIAKTKEGYTEGRPPIAKERIDNAVSLLENGHTYKEVTAITGISKSTLIRAKRKQKAK